mmetsp:Transcript_15742/g.25874  ORF Transcript_15742/g.25874 Transcript_15742/m.25874 type:complete len:443 (+) Transcript_15742:2-1330(+)
MHCTVRLSAAAVTRRAGRAILRAAVGKHLTCPPGSFDVNGLPSSHHDVVQTQHFINFATLSFSTNARSNNDENDETKASTFASQRASNWDNLFDVLKAYKSTHGDTFVPATYLENPQLGNWVDNQRQLYRMRLEAEESGIATNYEFITDDRIERLNSIGFIWNANDYAWNLRFEELKRYIEEHGNSCVPGIYPDNEPLGLWVAKQRRTYKVKHKVQLAAKKKDQEKGKNVVNETSLSEERIDKLNAVGFIWDVHEAQWLERYEELKKYRRDHGDTLVPKHYSVYPFLGRWVDKQRFDYKRFMAKKKLEESNKIEDPEEIEELQRLASLSTGMTEERVRLLDAEDFIWDPFNHAWEQKYNEFCMFVRVNGHAAIRTRRKGYDPLARWAEIQRKNYRKKIDGQKTTLTQERIDKLERIGFIWDRGAESRLSPKPAESKELKSTM